MTIGDPACSLTNPYDHLHARHLTRLYDHPLRHERLRRPLRITIPFERRFGNQILDNLVEQHPPAATARAHLTIRSTRYP